MPLAADELEYVRKFVRSQSAIVLDNKDYLIESRLGVLAGQEGFSSSALLVQRARRESATSPIGRKIVDALTTNETLFFRDAHPFLTLEQRILPELIERKAASKKLSIWSAACSTGQEPYSIAMLLRSRFPQLNSWKVEILATDLSQSVLDRARAGVFSQIEINRGLPAPLMIRFFEQQEGMWRINEAIRSMVTFRSLNLIEPWPPAGPFDVILLRNVMIYFDPDTRRDILTRISGRLAPAGFMLMGATESPLGLSNDFRSENAGTGIFFCKK